MTNETHEEYEAPSMTKLGSINDVTQQNVTGTQTDVPKGTPGSVVRLRVPDQGETAFDDLVKGRLTVANDSLRDEVILAYLSEDLNEK